MDQETAVMTAIIIALCALPFIYVYFKQKAAESSLLSKIKSLASAQGGTITSSSCEAGIAVGIDGNARQLYFCTSADLNNHCIQLYLDHYSACMPYKVTSIRGRGADKYEVIEKLGLALKPRVTSKADTILSIYDADESAHMGSHIQLMEKWVDMVQANLKSKPAQVEVQVAKAS